LNVEDRRSIKSGIFACLAQAAQAGDPVSLGLLVEVSGSSPQKAGAKALFYADSRVKGTLGGGCLEAEIQRRAIQALRNRQASTFELVLDQDFGWDDGLLCGGKVAGVIIPHAQELGADFWTELAERKSALRWGVDPQFRIQRLGTRADAAGWFYQETVAPRCALWIAGAGHIAQAVAPLALELDFDVTVFDDRPVLANPQFFPPGVQLLADAWDRLLAATLPEVPSFGLIVTRGHRHDALVLKEWIHKPFLFLGMIGSARKARTVFDHFIDQQLATTKELERVACPVGLRIQARTVPEIAVSILAQFIQKRAELCSECGAP
jgi:xanthine dehydrogenase accessory factor